MFKLKLPRKSEINGAISSFSQKERSIFTVLLIVLSITTLLIVQSVNKYFMVKVPKLGGYTSEGILGTPRFINPVLAFSDADKDMVALVYSGLMRKDGEGALIPDLADRYEVSEDNLTYTFTLKKDITFHDGKKLTADDIVFTITQVKDSILKSPEKSKWDGIFVEKIDDRTIAFKLAQPHANFLENTTIGILPLHIWQNSPLELNPANTAPVGTGPFLVNAVEKGESGIIKSYELVGFEDFILGKPYLKRISIFFYPNERELTEALKGGKVNQISSIDPKSAKELSSDHRIESTALPRVFGLFFNHNENQIFLNKTVVRAINEAIDKDRIITEVLSGYGVAIDEPIPPSISSYESFSKKNTVEREAIIAKVEADLAKDGWKKNSAGVLEKSTTQNKKTTTVPLQFSISTGNAPELAKSAEIIKEDLEKLGMVVEVKTFEIGNLNQSVIKPRDYDALLFGQIINNESDLYAFWHSSQRKDPGLNVAIYTNAKVDKILEDAFTTVDEEIRDKKYAEFQAEIKKDVPAVFLYSPNFIYVVSKELKGLQIKNLITPSDRFANAHLWYTETDNVWQIFAKKD